MPPSQVCHITISVRGRLAISRDEAERRALVRRLAEVARDRQLLFCLVDEHLHEVGRSPHPGRLADDLRRVLRSQRPDLEFKPPHIEPVGNRAYLTSLVRYVLQQPGKHGLDVHGALYSGSCFQDLVGARLLPGYELGPLLAELPRLRQRQLFEHLDLGLEVLEPAGDELLSCAGPARLVELAGGVYGVGPALEGRQAAIVRARALAIHAGQMVGIRPLQLARFLNVGPRGARKLRTRLADPRGLRALRVRLALEERVSQRAGLRSRWGDRRTA